MCGKLSYLIYVVVALGMIAAPCAEAADPTLIGWWKFEEASGILQDEGDYNNDGTGNGVVYQQTGMIGYALGFDGVNDTVVVGANGRPFDTFTFGGWFKTSSTHEIEAQSTTGAGGVAGQRYAFEPAHGGDSNGGAGLSVGTNGISVYEHGSNYMPPTAVYATEIGDEWNHIMVVYTSKQPTIYLNGELVHTGLTSPRAAVIAPIQFGGMAYGYFEGLMDEVRIYNRALTQPEIADLAAVLWATRPIPEDGSMAAPSYWEDNVYMILDYTPGQGAITKTAYFSDVKQDVIDRDAAHCLGSIPPWPDAYENAFVVGYDDPNIPEYARVPLVGGRTYYWCVDCDDGTTVWPGAVWSFTAMPKCAWGPSPADGDDLVSNDPTCTWHLGDQDITGLQLTYNVYCGTDEAAVAAIATGNTTAPQYKANVATETIVLADLDPFTEYFWRVDTRLRLPRPPQYPTTITKGDVWSFTTGPIGIGGILREWWTGITGVTIPDLTNDPDYPGNPAGSEVVNIFEYPPYPATTWQDNYGSRLHGWLYITQTGDYTFWIATDDYGQLWLSTDANPANASLISWVNGWADPRQWDDPDVTPSGAIHLEAGGMYYIMGLMKEEGGGDNISAAWQGPDSGGVREVIPGKHLIPYMPVIAENPDPGHRSVDAALNVTLRWDAGIDQSTDSYYTTQHVYWGSDAAAVAGATTASPEYKGGPTGPNEFGPLSLSYYDQVYWRIDGVMADSGTVVYRGAVWTFKAAYNPANVVDTNLKLWLKFEDNVLDSSGYGRDGTAYGGPTYVTGADGQAIRFDGVDDYVNIEVPVGISGDDVRTIAGWAKATTTAISDWATVFGFCPPWEANYQYFDIEKIGGGSQYGIHIHGEQWGLLDVDLEWHHIAVTYEPGWAAAYVDGALLIGLNTTGYALNTVDAVRMGYRPSQNAYFPGSVDDVRIYDVAKTAAEITEIMRIDLSWAWNPSPANGAEGVDRRVTLSWNPGDGATAHTIYLGQDPANMDQVAGPQGPNSYDPPGDLDLGTTYYWSVVESPGGETGRTWKFTTSNYLVVDDMETYVPYTAQGDHIYEAWRDAFGDCTPGNGNNTGSTLTENTDPPVLGGLQSMKYEFDNDGTVYNPCLYSQEGGHQMYSRIEAQVAGLPSRIGTDWTIGGVRALYLGFHGTAGNPVTEQFWVQLKSGAGYGSKVFYGAFEGESLDDFNEPVWHDWYIDLADFGVTLSNVTSIVIGIGDEGGGGAHGSGTLFIDDVRLYAPICMPQRAKSAADFDNSCRVDYLDIAAMFDVWLLQDLEETVWGGGVWTSVDVGDVNQPGSFTDHGGGAYTINGGGHDIWDAADDFHYVYKPLSGDGQMTVRVTDIQGPSTNDWRKAGVMIRETLDQDSSHAFMCITPAGGGGSSFQWRSTLDGDNNNQDGPAGVTMPQCIRLLRIGGEFRAFRYVGGKWVQHGATQTVPMVEDVLIGLAVTSHDATTSCTATFDRVCSDDFIEMDLILDDVINFEDYAELMNQWMDEVFWP